MLLSQNVIQNSMMQAVGQSPIDISIGLDISGHCEQVQRTEAGEPCWSEPRQATAVEPISGLGTSQSGAISCQINRSIGGRLLLSILISVVLLAQSLTPSLPAGVFAAVESAILSR